MRSPDALDVILVVIFLLGVYLGIEIRLTQSVPIPTALSGAAGVVLVAKHMQNFRENHVRWLLAVLLLYLGSILCATNYAFLGKRFTGLLQLSYSFVIGYAFYVTVLQFERRQLARIFLCFTILILLGCALENYVPAFRNLSDAVRGKIFSFGVYDADLRDVILYGRVRPKLFTSEPSAVTFGFSLFAFCWYVASASRAKLLFYGAMFAAGFALMRGPTLVLGLVLVAPYELLLGSRRGTGTRPSYDAFRILSTVVLTAAIAIVGVRVGGSLYAERIADIRSGLDPSFFSRVIAPPLVAADTIETYPIAGTGLTGEKFIDGRVRQIYSQASSLESDWNFDSAAHALTNYFWSHWIYLGLIWGIVMLITLSVFLSVLGSTSIAFCWIVWATFGQASGAYVSPKTWAVYFLACALTVIHERERAVRLAKVHLEPAFWHGPGPSIFGSR